MVGQRLRDVEELADKADVAIMGLVRGGKRLYGSQRMTRIEAEDALVLEAQPDALDEFRASHSLEFSDEKRRQLLADGGSEGFSLVEVVVPEHARIAGRSAQGMGLSWRQRTVLMGINREGRRITSQVRKEVVKAGDILLLLTPSDRAPEVIRWMGALPLADRGLAVTRDSKTWFAIGLFVAAVAAASLGLIYLPVALGIVVVGYVL